MDTVELVLSVPAADQDWLVGLLDDRATGFVQTDTELRAYVPSERWAPHLRETLQARLRAAGYEDTLTVRTVAEQNWNARWEASIDSVRVGPFLLCTTDADVPAAHADATVLRIDPKRSFGTGHHATTRLALGLLADGVTPGDRVVDVGTGTGVLAIAARRLGARSALGVDTDPHAVANARENAAQNDVADGVTIRTGSVEAVPDDVEADVIVINITRAVLLDLLPALRPRLADGGTLILSGILTTDAARMADALRAHDLVVRDTATEDGWWATRTTPARQRPSS